MVASTEIWERVVKPKNGGFSPEHARYVLSLCFSKKEKDRYLQLSNKAQHGTLSEREQAELDHYVNADTFLAILKSKARISLKRQGSQE